NLARQRRKRFELTQEEFIALLLQNCFSCKRSFKDVHIGIDCFDSQEHYERGNVFPCCSTCNYFKQGEDFADVLLHCEKVLRTQGFTLIGRKEVVIIESEEFIRAIHLRRK